MHMSLPFAFGPELPTAGIRELHLLNAPDSLKLRGNPTEAWHLFIGPACAKWNLAMRNRTLMTVFGAVAMAAMLPVETHAEKPVTRRGTSVMHYMTRNELRTGGEPSEVVGTIRLQANEQGRSSKQMLDIRPGGLEAGTNYHLIAVMGDDTNAFLVGDFNTDDKGRAKLSFMSKGQGRGGKAPVPDGINPLTDLRALGIENAATQTVAYAWIADATQFQYLIKRNLTPEDTNGTAAGSISLIANKNRVKFNLLAGGLGATNDYHLVLNSEIRMTVQSGDDGRLEIKNWPDDAPPVLELRSLAIWDAGSNAVLRTSLPK